jgi:hypothetical protein
MASTNLSETNPADPTSVQLGMDENVIRIEIVMAPVEMTSYESIDTVALKWRGRKLRPKGQEVGGKLRRRYLQPHLITVGN